MMVYILEGSGTASPRVPLLRCKLSQVRHDLMAPCACDSEPKTAPPALLVGKKACLAHRSLPLLAAKVLGAQKLSVNAAWYDIAFGGGQAGMQRRLMDRNRQKGVDELRSPNAYSCYHTQYCPADPPRRNEEAVIHGMGVWFRGSGLVWVGLGYTPNIQCI